MEQENLRNLFYSSISFRLFLGIPYSAMKRAKLSEESISTKRKHVAEISSTRRNGILSNRTSQDSSTKKLKTNTNNQRDTSAVEIHHRSIYSTYEIASTF